MAIIGYSSNMLVEVNDRQPIMSKQLTIWSMIELSVMMATLRPYKSETANHTAVCLTALLAAVNTLYILLDTSIKRFYHIVLHHIRRKVNFKTIVGVCKKCFK